MLTEKKPLQEVRNLIDAVKKSYNNVVKSHNLQDTAEADDLFKDLNNLFEEIDPEGKTEPAENYDSHFFTELEFESEEQRLAYEDWLTTDFNDEKEREAYEMRWAGCLTNDEAAEAAVEDGE